MSGRGPRQLPLLEDLGELTGRRALVRVDFNVPLTDDGQIADDFRMRAALPTLEWLRAAGAEVTAIAHLGRPQGAPDPRWDMAPVRARLAQLCPGVALGENLRFNPGEAGNDPAFVRSLVEGQDVYVDEAFGVAHRAHASVVGPPAVLPSAAGRELIREVVELGNLLDQPARPFVALVGGAKVADKLGVLDALAGRVDTLAIGGAMAYTFLAALGHDVGDSLVDLTQVERCRRLLSSGTTILLPTDVVALEPGDREAADTKVLNRDIPDGWTGLDVGPETAAAFADAVAHAATVFWNGPLGKFEDVRFAAGTSAVARAVAESAAHTVVGGGDSVRALEDLGLARQVDFLSTGGGASLVFLECGDLPGLAALRHAPNVAN